MQRTARVYPIGVVQELTDLTGRQIRYYEQQGLVSPRRSPGNRRLFSPADVERLQQIRELLAQGMTLAGVRQALTAQETAQPLPSGRSPRTRAGTRERPPGQWGPATVPLPDARGRVKQLTSLYPVNQQGELTRFLQSGAGRGPDKG